MEATHKMEEPLFGPNSFAGVMLSAERFFVEVCWERGMVSETFSFCCNRFFGCCNYHVDIEIQPFHRFTVDGVSFERSSKKFLNRSDNPVEETVLARK